MAVTSEEGLDKAVADSFSVGVEAEISILAPVLNLFPHELQLCNVTRMALPLPLLGTTSQDLFISVSSFLHLGQIAKIFHQDFFMQTVKLTVVY